MNVIDIATEVEHKIEHEIEHKKKGKKDWPQSLKYFKLF